MKLIFATQNPHKAKEINALLGSYANVSTLFEIGIFEEIPENGSTLEENATQKALEVYKLTNLSCFADDTGLEVEMLNNAPGVFSARYAGIEKNSNDNIALLLKNLNGIKNRSARFRTIICLILNNNKFYFEGVLKGNISLEPKGIGGFGYDPVFVPLGFDRTLAEMTLDEKNLISHRAIAFNKLKTFLQHYNSA